MARELCELHTFILERKAEKKKSGRRGEIMTVSVGAGIVEVWVEVQTLEGLRV